MAAGEAELTVDQGTTWNVKLTYKQSTGTPFDLSGYNVRMDIRYAQTKEADALHQLGGGHNTHIYIADDPTTGVIQIDVPFSTTKTWLPGKYYYDVELYNNNTVDRVIYGALTVTPEVTAA